jgi:lipopolysaccharide biosynthesis protein
MTDELTYKKQIAKYKDLLEQEKESHTKTKIKLLSKTRDLHSITQSGSYKLAKRIAHTKHIARIIKNHIVALTPKRYKLIRGNRRYVRRSYSSVLFTQELSLKPSADLAVVLHLYYPELLGYFMNKLKNLSGVEYDLFITLPDTKTDSIAFIKKAVPSARIAIVPNCGRDVLPFVQVIKQINGLGYKKVLKLHTKKSPHRQDGDIWRDEIVGNLLPKRKTVQNNIQIILNKKKTAIIGPAGQYVSLLVNYSSTHHHTHSLLEKIFNKKLATEMVSIADEYGFFAGTMFWARMDALRPIIDTVNVDDFEPELGQEDSTFAHALERLFSVIPELYNQHIFEVSNTKLVQLGYHTTNIPHWSEAALED